jgi:beta-aspartyl-peptidase (threonine type)
MSRINKIAFAIHGGAGEDSEFIRQHIQEYEASLKKALDIGHVILKKGGAALDAVEESIKNLEDNPLFNAGRGSALNHKGEIEMDASIMDGNKLKAGAVCSLRNIKNPVSFARYILTETNHVLVSGQAASQLLIDSGLDLEPDSYFITEYQVEEYMKARDKEKTRDIMKKKIHGTVGAVALDKKGNLAAATSTGGTCNCHSGRIGDSALIGAGCYANNSTCAVSGTGDGEILITRAIAHYVSAVLEFTKCGTQNTCDFVVHKKNKNVKEDIGIIVVSANGEIGIAFNSVRMHRAWINADEQFEIKIYK